MEQTYHQSVLTAEVTTLLAVQPKGLYVDATVGDGGHALAILQRLHPRHGFVVGIDQDPVAVKVTQCRLQQAGFNNFRLFCANFRHLRSCLRQAGITAVDGVVFDLGMSARQLQDPSRGFSYHRAGPLDMRMNPANKITAAAVLQHSSEANLTQLLVDYGEVRNARRLAHKIIEWRTTHPIMTTTALVKLVKTTVPSRWSRTTHPARRLFQALRIAVNDELQGLRAGLMAAGQLLRARGRLAVISFHSLEDRIVKHYFRALTEPTSSPWRVERELPVTRPTPPVKFRLLTRRPLTATAAELLSNRRARSAKLRGIERL